MSKPNRIWAMLREVETGYIITDLNSGEVFTADNLLDAMLYVMAIQARADRAVIRDVTRLMRTIRAELRKSAVISYTGLAGALDPIAESAPPENTKGATTGAGICALCGKKTYKNREKTISVCIADLDIIMKGFPALQGVIKQHTDKITYGQIDPSTYRIWLEDLHGKCAKAIYQYLAQEKFKGASAGRRLL